MLYSMPWFRWICRISSTFRVCISCGCVSLQADIFHWYSFAMVKVILAHFLWRRYTIISEFCLTIFLFLSISHPRAPKTYMCSQRLQVLSFRLRQPLHLISKPLSGFSLQSFKYFLSQVRQLLAAPHTVCCVRCTTSPVSIMHSSIFLDFSVGSFSCIHFYIF